MEHNPEALVWARTQAELEQGQLAQKAGISPSYMCQLEKGDRSAGPELRAAFAQILGCPLSVLEAKRSA